MKIESLNVGLKIALFGYFRLTFEKKTFVTFEATSNFPKRKVSSTIKTP